MRAGLVQILGIIASIWLSNVNMYMYIPQTVVIWCNLYIGIEIWAEIVPDITKLVQENKHKPVANMTKVTLILINITLLFIYSLTC